MANIKHIKQNPFLPPNNISNEKIELYKEDQQYFFRVDFDYENDYGIYKGHIEKIPFYFNFMGIYLGESDVIDTYDGRIKTGERCKTKLGLQEEMDVIRDENGDYFTLTLVKEKIHKMTLNEIEKKLGYKVLIVNKNEE